MPSRSPSVKRKPDRPVSPLTPPLSPAPRDQATKLRLIAKRVAVLPPAARSAIRRAPEAWGRFMRLCDAAAHPDVELLAEDFDPILSTVDELLVAGVPLSPDFVANVRALGMSARGGDEDGDADIDVADFEADDPDDDRQDVEVSPRRLPPGEILFTVAVIAEKDVKNATAMLIAKQAFEEALDPDLAERNRKWDAAMRIATRAFVDNMGVNKMGGAA